MRTEALLKMLKDISIPSRSMLFGAFFHAAGSGKRDVRLSHCVSEARVFLELVDSLLFARESCWMGKERIARLQKRYSNIYHRPARGYT